MIGFTPQCVKNRSAEIENPATPTYPTYLRLSYQSNVTLTVRGCIFNLMSSTAITNVSAALGYDAVETMLSQGFSLTACYAFAATAACVADLTDTAPESASTVLGVDAPTVAPSSK